MSHPVMDPSATGYRLPTEAEWEYAARAGTTTAFASGPIVHRFSSPIDPSLNQAGWYAGNSGGQTRPVAGKMENQWGVFDKHGNVWEWTWDWYGAYAGDPVHNPPGAVNGSDKVIRGGSWRDNAEDARSALRFWSGPGLSFDDLGFRPVRTAPYRLLALSGDLDFGNVVVGQASVRELVLHNLGSSELDVQTVHLPESFSGGWTGTLGPAGSQMMLIQFSPPVSGPYEGEARVVSNSMGGEISVFLHGYGVIPSRILAIHGDLNFGAVLSGQSRSMEVVLQNQGSLPLQVNGLSVPRGFSTGWSGTLAPSATQAVQVHFQPTEVRTYSGNFAVSSDASGGVSSTPVVGWGVSEIVLHLSGDLDFGTLAAGETRIRDLVLQNISGAPVEISGISTPAGFSGNWSGTLAPSASQTVAIAFQPIAIQSYAGTLAVGTLASDAVYTLPVKGQAVVPVRNIQLAGDLDFGELGVGGHRLRELVIQNLGNATLQVNSLSLPQGFSGNFSGQVAPAASQVVEITFSPTSVQSYSGEVVAQSNATHGNNRIAITGTGAVPTRILSLSGNLDFGNVIVGTQVDRELLITNLGNADLTVSGISVPEGFSGGWSGTLSPSASQVVSITFAPQAEQSYSGTLTVHSDATAGENTISVSGLGLAEFSLIPAGWFTMGRTSGDTDSNAPPVNVYVSEFYMARYDVTWALWNEIRNWAVLNGYTDIATGDGKGAQHPVHTVNWWDVVKWCNARSEREGLTPVYRNANGSVFKTGTTLPSVNWDANGYRLPTEAEWEKAARGGVSGQRFPWGDTITHSQANCYSLSGDSYDISPTRGSHPTYNDGTTPYTSPVGSFGANGYGLYDMAGNVFEWCWDWYSDSAYTEGATDPRGAASGSYRVLRGGSWGDASGAARSAFRAWHSPDLRGISYGFRPARRTLTETRAISLSGNLDFGEVLVDSTAVRQLQIENQGNVDLTVTGLVLPDAFSGNWSGVIAPGATQGVSITFAPQAEESYTGTLTVLSDATAGENTMAVSGLGVAELQAPEGFSLIPAGWFTMGHDKADDSGDFLQAPRNVYVSEFLMARYEISWELWNHVRNWAILNGYGDLGAGAGKAANHPVHSVTWWDAVKWCNARSEMEGLTPVYRNRDLNGTLFRTGFSEPTAYWQANGYRLPTEAEWEKAARGGATGLRFPWGDTITHAQANYYSTSEFDHDISPTRTYHPDYAIDPMPYTAPLGNFAPNGFGLYEMSGNVSEWVWDWYSSFKDEQDLHDPRGLGAKLYRAIRGGHWNGELYIIIGMDDYSYPSYESSWLGFRVSRRSEDTLTASRILEVTPLDDLDFGTISIGHASARQLKIRNRGDTNLSIYGFDSPAGFSCSWTGILGPGESTYVDVHFAPSAAQAYGGTLSVNSNATGGQAYATLLGAGQEKPFAPAGFSYIPEGWFTMGRTRQDVTLLDAPEYQSSSWTSRYTLSDAPPVQVYVNGFYIAQQEVTWALWNEVRNWAVLNGYTDIATGEGKGATHPVHTVNWWDVVKWCNARSEREGLTAVYQNADGSVFKTGTTLPSVNWDANGYRLPTEAEWEKAARGGISGQRFPWGDTSTHTHANYYSSSLFYLGDSSHYHAEYSTGNLPYSSPVGSFAANGYGLYDMIGNLSEWCWDWYSVSAYTEGAINPRGPASGTARVLRGGSWRYLEKIATRGGSAPGNRQYDLGFRPARSSAAPAPENRSISLSGPLDFGEVVVGAESVRQLQIENQGNVDLTVTGLVLPAAFSGNWTGVIAPGATQGVSITFAPQAEESYTGTLSVQSNATEGQNTIEVSGLGVAELQVPEGFSVIPAGWFTMGRTSGDTDSNAPPVNVYVSEFYMARHEVTWALWNEVRDWAVNNGYSEIATGGGKGATHPVHTVNWWDVVKWLNARSEREGLTAVYRNADGTVFKTGTTVPTADWNANGYRLPTEAEWEKAARGGVSGQRFPWGDTITHSQANYYSSSSYSYDISPTRGFHPTYDDGTMPYTSPVGSFGANGYGLYDMAGNVREWCWDRYSASSYTEGAADPKGPTSGTDRVIRGGSWLDGAGYSRSAVRNGSSPGGRYGNFGFRPARSSVP